MGVPAALREVVRAGRRACPKIGSRGGRALALSENCSAREAPGSSGRGAIFRPFSLGRAFGNARKFRKPGLWNAEIFAAGSLRGQGRTAWAAAVPNANSLKRAASARSETSARAGTCTAFCGTAPAFKAHRLVFPKPAGGRAPAGHVPSAALRRAPRLPKPRSQNSEALNGPQVRFPKFWRRNNFPKPRPPLPKETPNRLEAPYPKPRLGSRVPEQHFASRKMHSRPENQRANSRKMGSRDQAISTALKPTKAFEGLRSRQIPFARARRASLHAEDARDRNPACRFLRKPPTNPKIQNSDPRQETPDLLRSVLSELRLPKALSQLHARAKKPPKAFKQSFPAFALRCAPRGGHLASQEANRWLNQIIALARNSEARTEKKSEPSKTA